MLPFIDKLIPFIITSIQDSTSIYRREVFLFFRCMRRVSRRSSRAPLDGPASSRPFCPWMRKYNSCCFLGLFAPYKNGVSCQHPSLRPLCSDHGYLLSHALGFFTCALSA